MRRANVQLQADRRFEILASGADLLCALGLPPDLDAGDLRRGRDEPGQPLSLLPLQGRDHRRHRGARPRRDRASSSPRSATGISSTGSRRSRSIIWSSAAPRKSRSVPRSWRRAAAILPSRASIRTWKRTCGRASSRCCSSAAERGEIRRDIDFDGTVTVLFALADGLSWRRAVEPSFNAEAVMPIVLRHGRAAARQSGIGQRQQDRGQSHESGSYRRRRPRRRGASPGSRPGICFRTRRRRAAPRSARRARQPKLFRVSVMDVAASSRAAASSCSRAAPRPTGR